MFKSTRQNLKQVLIFKFPHNSLLGGGELHTLSLVENLSKKGFNFYLVSSCRVLLKEFKKRKFQAQKIWAGKEPVSISGIIFFAFFSPYLFWRFFFILLRYKIKYKTKTLYCLTLTEKLLATLPAKFLGYSVFWMEHLRIEKWLTANPLRPFYVLFSGFATTITVSYAVKKQLLSLGISEDKVKVIYNGVDINKFKSSISDSQLQNHKIIIGTVCRLCVEKGVDYLIRATGKVLDQGYDAELEIIGTGPEKENLAKLAKNLGILNKIKFYGFQNNILSALSRFDIFALTPTRRESFGISVTEAQAVGLPVVVTNISGLLEVVENSITGFVVPAQNIDAIATALIKLIENPKLRIQMGLNGRKRVEKYFTTSQMVNKFERVFQNYA
jgi:glycosyltransferase involved in cell wall biosynthesis